MYPGLWDTRLKAILRVPGCLAPFSPTSPGELRIPDGFNASLGDQSPNRVPLRAGGWAWPHLPWELTGVQKVLPSADSSETFQSSPAAF